MNYFDLSGKVAVVTGGNGGIGFAMAKALARAGASVAIAGRNAQKSRAAAQAIEALGVKVITVEGDLMEEAACRRVIDRAAEAFGRLDVLINNAGIAIRKLPQDYSAQEWHRVLDTNLTSAFLCSHAAWPHMKRAGGGKIISIGSIYSVLAAPFTVAYATSKGGLVQMTRALATAWAPDNIQVNAVLPGWIRTDLTERARAEVPGLNEKVLARTPAARWGEPADLEAVAVFLAGSGSQFITGAAIPVDGGYAAAG